MGIEQYSMAQQPVAQQAPTEVAAQGQMMQQQQQQQMQMPEYEPNPVLQNATANKALETAMKNEELLNQIRMQGAEELTAEQDRINRMKTGMEMARQYGQQEGVQAALNWNVPQLDQTRYVASGLR